MNNQEFLKLTKWQKGKHIKQRTRQLSIIAFITEYWLANYTSPTYSVMEKHLYIERSELHRLIHWLVENGELYKIGNILIPKGLKIKFEFEDGSEGKSFDYTDSDK